MFEPSVRPPYDRASSELIAFGPRLEGKSDAEFAELKANLQIELGLGIALLAP